IAPLAYEVNPNLVVGGSLDLVWAMMDLKMALPGFYFATAENGGLVTDKQGAYAGIPDTGLAGSGRIDFSDSNDYTGKAKATGWAGKLGFTYKLSPTMTLGGTYHSKTALGDLKTGANGATFYGDMNGDGSYSTNPMDGEMAPGKVTVHNFEWPETYGLGLAIQATPDILVAMDYKRIGWSDVMKNFSMTFSNGYGSADFTMPQNWDDQDVFLIGVAYKATPALTLRVGANVSSNPIPDSYLNYLFPAIVEDHYTVGFGYAFNPSSSVDFSLQYAPKVTATNPGMPSMMIPAVAVDHGQTSWQLMYSQKF
ncbi:MAG: outer membrane protein transport protein, partial [Gallionellaceae bacterium]|nr:outer membrane protein transport protein [Gallionellaceae bacterium]